MGNDAYIFAEKAKECYYFDRKYNVLPGSSSDVYFGNKAYQTAYDKLSSLRKQLATKEEVMVVTEANIRYWENEGDRDRHRVEWNKHVQAFVGRHADDERYFILGDCDDPYSHDVIENEAFVSVGD